MNDALEQRAGLHLLELVERERRHTRSRQRVGLSPDDRDGERPRRLGRFESALETFQALGAIPAAEAAAWRSRFEAAGTESEGPRPAPDADTRRLVEELFAEKRRGRRWTAEKRLRSFRMTLFALEAVGTIPLEETYAWIDRFCAENGLPTRKDDEERDRARWCTALDLRRVIAAPMTVGRLQISRLELYSDGTLLYSLETAPDGRGSLTCGASPATAKPFSPPKKPSPLKVRDDLGTVYESQPYHGFAKVMTPAVPDSASRLEISYAGAAGQMALR